MFVAHKFKYPQTYTQSHDHLFNIYKIKMILITLPTELGTHEPRKLWLPTDIDPNE